LEERARQHQPNTIMCRPFFALLLLLAATAIPPPLVAPPFASGRIEDMSAVFAGGRMSAKQYGFTFLKFATDCDEVNVLRRDAVDDVHLPAPPNNTPLLDIMYQINKGNQTKSWSVRLSRDGVWSCTQVSFPFPTRNLLADNCDQGVEDIIGTVETWKYHCDIGGLAVDIWVLQNPAVAIQVENVVGPFGIFPATTTWYLDFAPLDPGTTAKSLLPPAAAGCNITGIP
jgi:hypothetical protein